MNTSKIPLVSVVTPVYNGEKYLCECIESVLKQTYDNWEYIILNNCSDDDTLRIAEKYASGDERIKVITNDTFLKQIPNWNEALRHISPESRYCKVIHADDWITPDCLQKMVERGEEFPSAGIISAYRFKGPKVSGVRGKGLGYATKFLSGKEAGRRVLKTSLFPFGSPSTLMYRSDLVRERQPFYDPAVVHADTDVCFALLQQADFAFVHQLLSCTRYHDEAASTFADHYQTYILHDLYALKMYGHHYLSEQEYNETLSRRLTQHHRKLAKIMYNGRGKEVWRYHQNELAKMNLSIDYSKIGKAFIGEAAKVKPPVIWMRDRLKNLFSPADNENEKQELISNKKQTIVGKD